MKSDPKTGRIAIEEAIMIIERAIGDRMNDKALIARLKEKVDEFESVQARYLQS